MATKYFEKTVMLSLTNAQITITGDGDSLKKLFILVDIDSSASATISGSADTIGGLATSSITLKAGQSMEFGTGQIELDDITIIAPSGCTVLIYGHKLKNIQI